MKNNVCNISFKSNIKFCTKEEFEANQPKNFVIEYPKDYNKFFKKQMYTRENIQSSQVFRGILKVLD